MSQQGKGEEQELSMTSASGTKVDILCLLLLDPKHLQTGKLCRSLTMMLAHALNTTITSVVFFHELTLITYVL
jgi:hypothetical protein